MSLFLRIFKHLLPRARAWSITVTKNLRTFWQSLTPLGIEFKDYADQEIFDNRFAYRTELVDEWYREFGILKPTGLSEQQLRDRLDARWKETGGQSPYYIQNTLQNAGFDVYVHPWWFPIAGDPPFYNPQVKDPFNYLRKTYLPGSPTPIALCGDPDILCGEVDALCGNIDEKIGYPLVNKIWTSREVFNVVCGESEALCGQSEALCGQYEDVIDTMKVYELPTDPTKWPFFVYIGGSEFPNLASVDQTRKDEFEDLCLKICPMHLGIGVLVKYL
jgi:hypothetical protein